MPAGTSINFVTEGGQVEAIKRTSLVNGIALTSAQFVSANPRPEDGRVTVTAYSLGEESFVDQNGNNIWDKGEPFQDLGNIHKDRNFDGAYDKTVDEYVPTEISNGGLCVAPTDSTSGALANAALPGRSDLTDALLRFDASIPSVGNAPNTLGTPGTCDGTWSGAGKVYVRRAIETVLSTSAARLLWEKGSYATLPSACTTIPLQTGPNPTVTSSFVPVDFTDAARQNQRTSNTNVVFTGSRGTLRFYVADNNTYRVGSPFTAGGAIGRFNAMAAGTKITVVSPTIGVTTTIPGGQYTNPSTRDPAVVAISVDLGVLTSGLVIVTAQSPSGLSTSYNLSVVSNPAFSSSCNP